MRQRHNNQPTNTNAQPSEAGHVLQRRVATGPMQEVAPPAVHEVLRAPGQPLAAAARSTLEPRFGHDFSRVRVHTDEQAAASARAVSAQAYTVGRHVVFDAGQYAPGTQAGQELLAHELAHVAQQGRGPHALPSAIPVASPFDAAEQQAQSAARSAVVGRVSSPPLQTALRLARQPRGPIAEREEEEVAVQEREVEEPPSSPPPARQEVERRDYAFFFTGGAYGRAARRFIETYHPHHHMVEARSFEEMFDRLYGDMRRVPRGRDVRLGELVIVTHANAAGGLRIPLTRADVRRRRFFNLWDLAALQREFRAGLHERFRSRRHEVATTLFDEASQVIVRGCEFGQADEALDALRSLFGGQPYVWAPRGFQGYETLPIGRSFLRTPEQAFDFLMERGYLPPELQPIPDEQKRHYIARVFGVHGSVPADFLVMGREAYTALSGQIRAGRGTQASAEPLKTRDEADLPSHGEFWGLSAPSALGEDPELDALSLNAIEARARALNTPYRPENAAMLQRLRRAWERKGLAVLDRCDANDPLCGLPPSAIFGDPNGVAIDANQYPGPRIPARDLFEAETITAPAITDERRTRIGEFDEPPATAEPERRAEEGRASGVPPAHAEAGREAAAEAYRRSRDFSKVPAPPPLPLELIGQLSDLELGREYMATLDLGELARLAAIEEEIARRLDRGDDGRGFGTALPRGETPYLPANAGVEPDIALRILENVARGEPPFRPELGRVGRVSWFVTEGTPYVGRNRSGSVIVEAELAPTEGRLVFREADLLEIFEREQQALRPEIEARFGIKEGVRPNRRTRQSFAKLLREAAESRMWERVGERVRGSSSGVGEVVLENSQFSRSGNGRFGVVAEHARTRVRLRGGPDQLIEALRARGLQPDPTVTAAAHELAARQRWSGRVRGAFRYGGRILIIVGLANDTYRIYTARDRTRAVISVAGGWAGAVAAGKLFAVVWTPADTAGPLAWVVHGVGTLLAGGVGYFVGSEITTYVYELVTEDEAGGDE